MFDYFNVRVYDDEKTDLLKHWDNTFKYITRARREGSKVLVHCKMGVSRSASVVIAYAMKAYNLDFKEAQKLVKEKRSCIKPNKSFLSQLETYQGMLLAMRNKDKLQRSKSETNLKSPKDARLLPGSEPTPLIQALNVGKNLLSVSGKDLKKLGDRPKSWSPDNVIDSVLVAKQQSQSLEHIGPVAQKEMDARHIRLPCSNGQHYSVSQNQAVHLQEENMPVPSVKLIVSELESKEKRKTLNLSDDQQQQIDEIWDPGENLISVNINDSQKKICDSPVWTSSAQIIHQTPIVNLSISETKGSIKNGDLFSAQLDRVFDREERKQNRFSTAVNPPIPLAVAELSSTDSLVSRQSSWSSVDSAVVLGSRDTPSRHSSWGSGDNRTLPSRNSSWGSYDMRSSSASCNDPKLLTEKQEELIMGNSGIFPFDKDEIPWHPGTVKRTKQKIEELSAAKRICSESNDENKMMNRIQQSRCHSEEVLAGTSLSSSHYSRLSASAPETSAIGLISPLRRFNLKTRHSIDESLKSGLPGIVRSLKMNFEAKSKTDENGKKVKSLPSSPVAVHIDLSTSNLNKENKEDISVKGLVDKYEVTKMRPIETVPKQRPRSVFETKQIHMTKPFMITHSTIISKTDEYRRPPVPPTVKNAIGNIPISGVSAAKNVCKKVQQHGKTHPLARLGLSKQRVNTSAAYNTM